MSRLAKILAVTPLFLFGAGSALASQITYEFNATGFLAFNNSPVPNSSLSGSFTVDGTSVTGVNLTIGSHTYTTAEVTYDPDHIYPGNMLIGGAQEGANGIQQGTDDFWLGFNFYTGTPTFTQLFYGVSGVQDIFRTITGTVVVISNVSSVPLPASAWLMLSGLGGLGLLARNRKAV